MVGEPPARPRNASKFETLNSHPSTLNSAPTSIAALAPAVVRFCRIEIGIHGRHLRADGDSPRGELRFERRNPLRFLRREVARLGRIVAQVEQFDRRTFP